MNEFTLAIHGGAGALTDLSEYRESITRILGSITEHAVTGMSALDLVERAVMMLEDDPLFNAGKGSVLNALGKVECEASIADGRTLDVGGVINVSGIKNPVTLARAVLEKSPHVLLAADGAVAFAKEEGFAITLAEYFITEKRKQQLIDAQEKNKIVLDHSDVDEKKLGTVGAVALDKDGNLAAATSTGGIVNKRFGRVGDSSIMGAGVYAENDLCAISATGYGEQFLRTSLAKHVAEYYRYHEVPMQEAANAGIDFLVKKVSGLGGIICISHKHEVCVAHSTPLILAGSISHQAPDPHLYF